MHRHNHRLTHLCHRAGWKSISPALEILRTFLYKTQSSPIPAGHAWSGGGANQMTSRIHFQLKLFHVSINLMKNLN